MAASLSLWHLLHKSLQIRPPVYKSRDFKKSPIPGKKNPQSPDFRKSPIPGDKHSEISKKYPIPGIKIPKYKKFPNARDKNPQSRFSLKFITLAIHARFFHIELNYCSTWDEEIFLNIRKFYELETTQIIETRICDGCKKWKTLKYNVALFQNRTYYLKVIQDEDFEQYKFCSDCFPKFQVY